MKRLYLLLPLLAAAPVFALSLKPLPEEPYTAPTLPWREALAAADATVGAATNGARCVILTWRRRDATWCAVYDAGDAYRSVTVDAAGRCVEKAAKDPPWNSPAEFLPLAEAAAAAERASAGAVRTAALSRPDATWYVALSDDGTRKSVVVSPDGTAEPVPQAPKATAEDEMLRLPASATPSPAASKSHAESAENAESEPHAASAEGAGRFLLDLEQATE